MAWLSAYRCAIAWPDMGKVAPAEALRALATGARFDSVIATIVILPTVAIGGLLSWLAGRPLNTQPLRRLILWLFFIATALVYAGNYQFYRIMGTEIDQRVLALANDGDGAVRSTIWQAHHPLLFLALGLLIGTVAALSTLFLVRRMRQGSSRGLRNRFAQAMAVIALSALMFGLVRGFAWGETPIRVRNAYVSQSAELNRLIPSPYAFWLHAMETTADRSAPDAAELAGASDVQDEARDGRRDRASTSPAAWLERRRGRVRRPEHIFLARGPARLSAARALPALGLLSRAFGAGR